MQPRQRCCGLSATKIGSPDKEEGGCGETHRRGDRAGGALAWRGLRDGHRSAAWRSRELTVMDASDLLGAPQLAGVVVSPVGLFRKIESSMTVVSGGVVVPGSAGPAIADKLAGASAGPHA